MPATTPSEEDAVLDKLFTKDGVFGVEYQTNTLSDGSGPGFRAFYRVQDKPVYGMPYLSCIKPTASEAYRAAFAAMVANKMTNS